jgi:gas vesicle protein
MSAGKIAIGVLAGVAVGAILGILFAPDKGSETRKKLTRRGSDLVDELKDKVDSLSDSLTQRAERARGNLKKDSKVEMG